MHKTMRSLNNRNTNILPSHGDTWKLVKRHHLNGEWWSSSLNQSIISIPQVFRSFRNGYSLVLNKIQHSSPNIRRIVNNFQTFFGHKVNANLYITPGEIWFYYCYTSSFCAYYLNFNSVAVTMTQSIASRKILLQLDESLW